MSRFARVVNRALGSVGMRLTRIQKEPPNLRLVERVHDMACDRLVKLPQSPGRASLLAQLLGTDVFEGMYLLEYLHRSLRVQGDICEFGVAQGRTSALIANELVHHGGGRTLWLYDSFAGLPAPSSHDRLIDDMWQLGSMEAYTGQMSVPRTEVEARLRDVGWTRTRIVSGVVDQTLTELPNRICFAYVDFDLHQPTWDVLALIRARVARGGSIMVDDYGYFSSGVQKAVDRFVADSGWRIERSPSWAGPFVVLSQD